MYKRQTASDVTIIETSEVIQDVFGNTQVSYKGRFAGFNYFALTNVATNAPLTNDIENADLVINNASNGVLFQDTNGTKRRVFATNGNVFSATTTTGDNKAFLDIGDIRLTSTNKGLILRKPNGGYVKLTIDNSGNLTYTSINTLPSSVVRLDDGDLEFGEQSKGVILKSPSNTCWRLVVNTSGVLSALPVVNCN